MIVQRYKTIKTVESPSINRILEIATINDGQNVIISGGNGQSVQIHNVNMELIQEIPFDGWVRACSVFDMDGDDNFEFAIGSGDNTLRVFNYNSEKKQFDEAWRHEFKNNVSAVAAGDINADGRIEVIAGSWEGDIGVFDAITGFKLYEFQFHEWIVFLKVLDANWDGVPEIIVGLKKGDFGVINGITGECYWQHIFEKRVNDCEMVHLANNPYPHLLVAGDDKVLSIFDIAGNLVYSWPYKGRILAITSGDIDGDCYNEVILGTGDNRVVVLQTPDDKTIQEDKGDILDLEIRWKARVENVPTSVRVFDLYADDVPEIVVTGYFKQIKVLQDFFFGEEPQKIQECEERIVNPGPHNYQDFVTDVLELEYPPELIYKNGVFFFPKEITDISELITYPESLNKSRKENQAVLLDNTYDFKSVIVFNRQYLDYDERFKNLKAMINISQLDEIDTLATLIVNSIQQEIGIEPEEEPDEEALIDAEDELEAESQTISDDTIEAASEEESGVAPEEDIDDIDDGKTEDIPDESEKEPQEEEDEDELEDDEDDKEIPKEDDRLEEKQETEKKQDNRFEIKDGSSVAEDIIIKIIKKQGRLSKSKIIAELGKQDINEDTAIRALDFLKNEDLIQYYRSKPRGYDLVAEEDKVEKIIEKRAKRKSKAKNKEELFIETFREHGIVAKKSQLAEIMKAVGISAETFEIIYKKFRDKEAIYYSATEPRGYSLVESKLDFEADIDDISEQKELAEEDNSIDDSETDDNKTKNKDTDSEPEPEPEVKVEQKKEDTDSEDDPRELMIKLLRKSGRISTQGKVISYFIDNNIDEDTATEIWEKLKEDEIVEYSRSKPSGWALKEE